MIHRWIAIACVLAAAMFSMAARAAEPESIIPSERTFVDAWQRTGYPGKQIPSPATIVDVREF